MATRPHNKLISTDSIGVVGRNYYWYNHAIFNITKAELKAVGVVDGKVYIDNDLVQPLLAAKAVLESQGYTLAIVDGYRSPELYTIAYATNAKLLGQSNADGLINIVDMPHSSGRVIDVQLRDFKTNKELYLRDGRDGTGCHFVDYYKARTDKKSQRFQKLQTILINAMLSQGFVLGKKQEYWHFELP